jgi:hypothetical protein
VAAALGLAAVWLVNLERDRLGTSFQHIKENADAYLLPGIEETYVASLGYRSALADLIYGHVLVSYGIHFQENRLFENVVNRLDPKFRAPYWFADTLLTLQPKPPPIEFYRKARQIQERGLAALPLDQALWSAAGQYLAYLAPTNLTDPAEQEEYRRTGARYLMQACNLVGSNDAIPYHCVTAAQLLNKDGNRQAIRNFLERLVTVSDDPAIQGLALAYLKQAIGEQARAEAEARQERFRSKWHGDLALSPRVEIGAIGPGFDPASCAGLQRADTPDCASSWTRWAATGDTPSAP